MNVQQVIQQASMQDRAFILEITKGMTEKQLQRFCMENGFTMPVSPIRAKIQELYDQNNFDTQTYEELLGAL